ncbi:hypothetical protein [Amycolatopsis sp.]|uniref:hypothetical protein n=1 Tax=Amycolatopsis sp. TaxID=37632 RepID=UPI002DFDFA65|nr:hypothetical protein [Amycolatopsis sp.]
MLFDEASAAVRSVWGDLTPQKVYGGATGGGGTFEMSPGELDTVIGLWREEAVKILEDGRAIQEIATALRAPGNDDPSRGYVSAGIESIMALQDQNDSMLKYAQEYIKKLEAAKNATVKADQANTEPFTQTT